jgi:hypothetical protein
MAELKNEPIIAVKGRFRAPNQRYYGQFFYLINNKGGYIDIASVVITAGPDLYHALTPTDSWKKYESLINKLKYENKYSQAITNEFQAKLKQLSLDKQYFADLMKAVVGNKAETLNFVLASFYRRVIKDDEFYLEGHAEKASLDDTEEGPAVEEADLSGADGIYLPVKLDLDPISGKDVKEIRPGDKILVRVLPETERANAFIDSAGLRTESGFIRSAPFTVTSVIYPGVGVEIVGKLKEGIYGKILEEQNVLVRMAQPVKAATPAKAQVPLPTSIPDDRKQLTLIAIGIVGIALLGIALYWVISSL